MLPPIPDTSGSSSQIVPMTIVKFPIQFGVRNLFVTAQSTIAFDLLKDAILHEAQVRIPSTHGLKVCLKSMDGAPIKSTAQAIMARHTGPIYMSIGRNGGTSKHAVLRSDTSL